MFAPRSLSELYVYTEMSVGSDFLSTSWKKGAWF